MTRNLIESELFNFDEISVLQTLKSFHTDTDFFLIDQKSFKNKLVSGLIWFCVNNHVINPFVDFEQLKLLVPGYLTE